MTDQDPQKKTVPSTSGEGNISKETEISIVGAVSIQSRLLPFWRELPRAWFIQFEAVIDPLKISDDQKFRYVLQQLQSADLEHLTDILYNPPATNKYAAVKNRLLAVYDKSDVRNFQKLISGLELGDQKPTQLLRKMRELGGGMITDDGLKIEWLNQLPAPIRVVLSINTEATLDTLAAMADKMSEYAGTTTIAAVSSSQVTGQQAAPSPLDALVQKIDKLSLEVAELRSSRSMQRTPRRFFHSRYRSRSKSTNRRPASKPGDASWECKYHYKFGDKARRCESPCCRRKTPSEN